MDGDNQMINVHCFLLIMLSNKIVTRNNYICIRYVKYIM